MDFRKPLRKVLLVFAAQFGLFTYYLFEMDGGSTDDESPGRDSHDPSKVSFMAWFFAVLVIAVAGEDDVGPPFGIDFWKDKLNRVFREDGEKYATWSRWKMTWNSGD